MSVHVSQPSPHNHSASEPAAKYLHRQEKEWAEMVESSRPLNLLNLPLDILQNIVREIPLTDDLTSLALTHSTLHALVIPHIYSRFDIVWPTTDPTIESRDGVDALTYGLGTLVMAHDVFGENPCNSQFARCERCGHTSFCQHRPVPNRPRKTRRGNHFAQYTKKFSLGNGPDDWVKEYLITREGGKMLGSLVALAVGRMRNLESFTWDMPTGVLREVWLALASLEDRNDGQACRLERVWVRWHDNQDTWTPDVPRIGDPAAASTPSHLPRLNSNGSIASFHMPCYPTVQFPTVSVLPPLRSLSVLDIDEVSYVEEISVLVERSLDRLRELRIGVAFHAQGLAWARPKEDRSALPLTPASIGEQRTGGLLGIITSRFFSPQSPSESLAQEEVSESVHSRSISAEHQAGAETNKENTQEKGDDEQILPNETEVNHLERLLSAHTLGDHPERIEIGDPVTKHPSQELVWKSSTSTVSTEKRVLKLDVLELERVHLSKLVLTAAFEWSRLHTLTILGCRQHECFWKSLRKEFLPVVAKGTTSALKRSACPGEIVYGRRSTSQSQLGLPDLDCGYQLRITRIHTDAVSPAFLAFLKDTLAPDTLEHVFLQQTQTYRSSVTIEQIYKHIIRRHRKSLQKLLIDSDACATERSTNDPFAWRTWAVNRDVIACIFSGRMKLRELSISVEYKDWHYFLQRLSYASKLRSLHIRHTTDSIDGRLDPKETALQVLDILALRPELELCYLGVQEKCFEILEHTSNHNTRPTAVEQNLSTVPNRVRQEHNRDSQEEEGDDDDDDNSDKFDLETDQDDMEDTEDEGQRSQVGTGFRLREILFYDDKISIFKARYGRL